MNSEDSHLPISIQYVIKLCKQIIKDAREGKCTEEEVNNIISCIEAKEKGFINPREYLSAEEAMKITCMHRRQFFTLIKEHDIKCHKINNQPIGYHIDDIHRLKDLTN